MPLKAGLQRGVGNRKVGIWLDPGIDRWERRRMKDVPRFPTYETLWGPAKGTDIKQNVLTSMTICNLGAHGDTPLLFLFYIFNSAAH